MKFDRNQSQIVLGLSTAMIAVLLSGCGELVSGANLKPTVKYKPSTNASAAAEAGSSTAAATEVASSDGVGTLKGKIEFSGAFTTLPPLYDKGGDVKDKDVCAAVEAPNQTILVKDGGLANVFVYLRKPPKVPGGAPAGASLIFDQKACVFKPHAMLVPIGQELRILNSDGVSHNTHVYAVKNDPFNKVVTPNDTVGLPLKYAKAEQEPISVGCDIHSWMKAYHLPIDHPFAAVSAEDGTFEIKDLPAGKHEFKVWHEAGGMLEKARVVTIKSGDNPLTITVSASQLGK